MPGKQRSSPESIVRGIKRRTRRKFTAEEKIRIVLDGLRGIRLNPKDRVIRMIVAGLGEKFIFTASERGYGKKTAVDQYPLKRGGGKGVLNLRITPKIGNALGLVGINEEDLLLITVECKVIMPVPMDKPRCSGRTIKSLPK